MGRRRGAAARAAVDGRSVRVRARGRWVSAGSAARSISSTPRGTLIDEFGPQYAEFDLPIIDGLVRSPSTGQPSIDEARAELAARVIEALAARKDIAQRISQIDVRDAHDAVVLLQDDPALLHLGDDKFLERAAVVRRPRAGAAQAACRTSITWTCDSSERVYVRPAR